MAPADPILRFQCEECDRAFSRLEHLKRHASSHVGSRTYQCLICSKAFKRRDTLLRHEAVHKSAPSLLEQGKRACKACSKSKVRCSGTHPCARCHRRNLLCSFVSDGTQTPLDGMAAASSPPSAGQQRHSIIDDIQYDPSHPTAPSDPANNSRLMAEQSTAMDSPPPEPDGHLTYPTSFDPENLSDTRPLNYQALDASYWTPDILSSINWLPINLSLPFYDDGLLYPSSHDTTGSAVVADPQHVAETPVSSTSQQHRTAIPEAFVSPVSYNPNDTPSNAETSTSSNFYVDGDHARRPRVSRRRIINNATTPYEDSPYLPSFDLTWPANSFSPSVPSTYVSEATYCNLKQRFVELCVSYQPFQAAFESNHFLLQEQVETLIKIYFDAFHPTLPFVHEPTFSTRHFDSSASIDLLIAMMVLGGILLDCNRPSSFQSALFEILRRALAASDYSTSMDAGYEARYHAQALLLFVVASKVGFTKDSQSAGMRAMNELRLFVLETSSFLLTDGRCGSSKSSDWLDWAHQEELLRTVWCIWYVSLTQEKSSSNAFQSLPLSSMTSLPLPCLDILWGVSDPTTWLQQKASISHRTMLEALQVMYVEKKLPVNLGDWNHILLTYGVIHWTWEVQSNVQHPVAQLEPSAEKGRLRPMLSPQVWPIADPNFTKWRNAACDCFDLLHWQANAAIGLAGGYEPAKVLHLHFARLLILSPLRDIMKLADHLASPHVSASKSIASIQPELKHDLHRWAIQDQYKARLAAIHAGVVLWHVRRYSINGFYEPFAVVSATMTLWAISVFHARAQVGVTTTTAALDSAELNQIGSEFCDTILIDRPTDDELVQHFVRRGDTMKVVMTGTRNLWDRDAPSQILNEGKKLLSTLGAWPLERKRYISIIESLSKLRT